MTAAEADRYDAQRRPEFSTFGAAYRMRNKYPEAFAAGLLSAFALLAFMSTLLTIFSEVRRG